MTTARLYVDPASFLEGELTLGGADHHHISRVLRMRAGQALQVLDGKGGIARSAILEIASGHTVIMVGETYRVAEERPRFNLFQALPRGTKMDAVVQLCVELGTAALVPFACSRSRALDTSVQKRLDRWRKIALESSRVAGRPYLPEVRKACSWEQVIRELAAMDVVILADEAGGARPSAALAGEDPAEVGLIIGPEGGFSDMERRSLREVGACPVTLGNTVLRTETAGMVLMAAARCHYGLL